MHRLLVLALLMLAASSAAAKAQDESLPPHIAKAAEAALPWLDDSRAWTYSILPAVDSTALGCELLPGLPLPDAIEAYRLTRDTVDGAVVLHVSSDGEMTQHCAESAGGVLPSWRGAFSDQDGDGLADESDACPKISGTQASANPGCTWIRDGDSDGDGLTDELDFCPLQAGAPALNGCALLLDSDQDGAPDSIDICSRDPGLIRADFAVGCPADGSGHSTRQRAPDELCLLADTGVALHENPSPSAPAIGLTDDAAAYPVTGRDASGDWLRLESGWASADHALRGACYNIALINVAPGEPTGCWLRARDAAVNVRAAPHGKIVTRIPPDELYPTLGKNASGDWAYFRRGWASLSVIDLSGNCDQLPTLDAAIVSSGTRSFCAADYPGALIPRIDVGQANARVASFSLANRLRAQPALASQQIGEIPPRQLLDAVLDGPACEGAFVWWQVRVNGAVGWTVESDRNANVYYLEPVASATSSPNNPASPGDVDRSPSEIALPATYEMISSANLDRLDTIAILPVAQPVTVSWSADARQLVVHDADGMLHSFNVPFFEKLRMRPALPEDGQATSLRFSRDGAQLALADADGLVHLRAWDSDEEAASLRLSHKLPAKASQLAWSSDGARLAAISSVEESQLARHSGRLTLWHLTDLQRLESNQLAWRYSFPYPLTQLAISADDRWLAITGESAKSRRAALWVYELASGDLAHRAALLTVDGRGILQRAPQQTPGDFFYSSGDSLYLLDVAAGESQRLLHLPGAVMTNLAIRQQVIPGAEVLLAIASQETRTSRLSLVNALNGESPSLSLRAEVDSLAFSPDGRVLALAQTAADRVLILGAVAE